MTADAELADRICRMVAERGAGRTISPAEVARAVAGSDETRWSRLMAPVRAAAVRLALEGRIVIRRKGRIVDPRDFKGVYRLGPAPAEAGPGSTESVRPDSR